MENLKKLLQLEQYRSPQKVYLLIGAIVVCIAAIAAATSFHRELPQATPPSSDMRIEGQSIQLTSEAPQWKLLKLKAASQVKEHWSYPLPARVRIDETKASRVGTQLEGRITEVFVELGQSVKKGEPLFAVASPEIAALQADKDRAKVELDAAQVALDRVRAMVEARALPEKELLSAQQMFKQADVAYKLSLAKLQALSVSASEHQFTVAAPRTGVVVEKNVLPSAEVAPGGPPLMVIADLSTVWVVADMHESNAMAILPGTAAQIVTPNNPNEKINAYVTMISSVVDPEKHTLPVRVEVKNENGKLLPNTYAQMSFDVPAESNSTEVAATAILSDGAHQYVYVQEKEGLFSRRNVVAEPAHEGRITIREGLTPGEIVVEEGAILLDNQIEISN